MYNNNNSNNSSGSYNNGGQYNDRNSGSYGSNRNNGGNGQATPHVELYSTKILAGTRTYFLNLKEDRKGNKYLVIKESKRTQDGTFEKHQIIIYQEDFAKLTTGLNDVFTFLQSGSSSGENSQSTAEVVPTEETEMN
jgi:Protein of unknown function (DUF3276)